MDDCLFCKIINGDVLSHKVYEDENTLAFLDINPVNPGHTLVIPKKHYKNLYETPDDILAKLMPVVRKVAISIKKNLNAEGINIFMNNDPVAGQVIFHSHFHVIPRFEGDGFKHWKGKLYEEGEDEIVAKKLKFNL